METHMVQPMFPSSHDQEGRFRYPDGGFIVVQVAVGNLQVRGFFEDEDAAREAADDAGMDAYVIPVAHAVRS
jgi:hypothetical protein